MPKSKREKEDISLQRDCECTESVVIPPDCHREVPERLLQEAIDNKFKEKGVVRCLQQRVIVKKRDKFWKSSERSCNIEYNRITSFGKLNDNPHAVAITYKENSQDMALVILLRKEIFADQLCDQLIANTNAQHFQSGQFAETTDTDYRRRNSSLNNEEYEEIERNHYDNGDQDYVEDNVFSEDVGYEVFNMRNFDRFPRDLPRNVYEGYDKSRLAGEGQLFAYDREAAISQGRGAKPDWKCRYSDVKTVYKNEERKKDLLLAVENRDREPKEYAMLRFDNPTAANHFIEKVQVDGAKVAYVDDDEPATTTIQPYFDRNNSVYSRNSVTSTMSGFTSVNVRTKRRQQLNIPQTTINRDDLSLVPDDGEWDASITYITDNGEDTEISEDAGNVFLYVAHKIH